jgi:CTP:molybdopterin cytidylyltransferase MocA
VTTCLKNDAALGAVLHQAVHKALRVLLLHHQIGVKYVVAVAKTLSVQVCRGRDWREGLVLCVVSGLASKLKGQVFMVCCGVIHHHHPRPPPTTTHHPKRKERERERERAYL